MSVGDKIAEEVLPIDEKYDLGEYWCRVPNMGECSATYQRSIVPIREVSSVEQAQSFVEWRLCTMIS